MADVLLVASKVKALVASKGEGVRTSGEFIEAVSKITEEIIAGAVQQAKQDGMNTVKARHLPMWAVEKHPTLWQLAFPKTTESTDAPAK